MFGRVYGIIKWQNYKMDNRLPLPKRIEYLFLDGECYAHSPPSLVNLAANSLATKYSCFKKCLRLGDRLPWVLSKQVRDRVVLRALDIRSVERPAHLIIANARLALFCLLLEELAPPYDIEYLIKEEEMSNGFSGLSALCEFLRPFAEELKRLAKQTETRTVRWYTDFDFDPFTGCRFVVDVATLDDGPVYNYFWEKERESPFRSEGGIVTVDQTGRVRRIIKTGKNLERFIDEESYLSAHEARRVEFNLERDTPEDTRQNIESLLVSFC